MAPHKAPKQPRDLEDLFRYGRWWRARLLRDGPDQEFDRVLVSVEEPDPDDPEDRAFYAYPPDAGYGTPLGHLEWDGPWHEATSIYHSGSLNELLEDYENRRRDVVKVQAEMIDVRAEAQEGWSRLEQLQRAIDENAKQAFEGVDVAMLLAVDQVRVEQIEDLTRQRDEQWIRAHELQLELWALKRECAQLRVRAREADIFRDPLESEASAEHEPKD
jgi:hypothetical protein